MPFLVNAVFPQCCDCWAESFRHGYKVIIHHILLEVRWCCLHKPYARKRNGIKTEYKRAIKYQEQVIVIVVYLIFFCELIRAMALYIKKKLFDELCSQSVTGFQLGHQQKQTIAYINKFESWNYKINSLLFVVIFSYSFSWQLFFNWTVENNLMIIVNHSAR